MNWGIIYCTIPIWELTEILSYVDLYDYEFENTDDEESDYIFFN